MAIDFSKILQKQATAIEKPKPLPVGMYLCNVPQLAQFTGIGKNETPCANMPLIVLQPGDDVDQEQLKEYSSDGRQWKGKKLTKRFFLSEAAEYRSKQEIVDGFQLEEEGKTLGQLFNETVNKQVWAKVTHRPSDDGQEMYMEVGELLPA